MHSELVTQEIVIAILHHLYLNDKTNEWEILDEL